MHMLSLRQVTAVLMSARAASVPASKQARAASSVMAPAMQSSTVPQVSVPGGAGGPKQDSMSSAQATSTSSPAISAAWAH